MYLVGSWHAYRGTDAAGWDGSLVAGISTDIPMPIPTPSEVAFDAALMAAIWRMHPDTVFAKQGAVASGMTPSDMIA
jgi:hypothetical protein